MSNINKEELISYLNNQKDMNNRLSQTIHDITIIDDIIDDIMSFVNNMKTEEDTKKKIKTFSCRDCKYCVKCMYDDINYRCNKYNLLMLGGIPSSDICQNND